MADALCSVVLSVIYCIYISSFFTVSGGGYSNLQQMHNLFLSDNLLLAGWVYYLAFDLLIGFVIIKGAQDYKVSHLLIVPCLFLTFLLGPAGYLLFQIIKFIKTKNENFFSQN